KRNTALPSALARSRPADSSSAAGRSRCSGSSASAGSRNSEASGMNATERIISSPPQNVPGPSAAVDLPATSGQRTLALPTFWDCGGGTRRGGPVWAALPGGGVHGGVSQPGAPPAGTADLVLVNGKLWTVDPARPEVEALAVWHGRIQAVG